MNHIYRSIWNASTGTVTAVSEHAKSRGRKTSGGKRAVARSGFISQAVSAALALSCGSTAYASPTGGAVVAGNASINSASGNTTIHQTTQNAALNWQSFDIGIAESVQFVQPNSNSVALNRVLGSDPSNILGSLSSNGKVFLINPNGILFGTGAQVNVGGLVAATRDIADNDFMAGRYEFNGSSGGGIVNQGSIHADGGYVALLGASVSNQGVITARMGNVALASGNALTLDVAGDGLLNVTVNAGAVDALVHNGGLIQADGGQVLLTARSAGALLQSAVNNTGVIQAQTIQNRNGTIKLLGDMQSGTVSVGGALDASAPNGGDGGFIDTSAAHVNVVDGMKVTTTAAQGLTGSWLIDPNDYTIASSGGDITGAQLSSDLVGTNITIQSSTGAGGTAGNVNVNDTVAWSANRLTLNAQNDININTAMNASGTASLALEYGQSAVAAGNTSKVNMNAPVNLPAGNNFSTKQGSNGSVVNYTVINSLGAAGSTTGNDLQGMNGNLARNYVLGSNIDASGTSSWNAGAGFTPIGTDPSRYTGIFDGLGHTVSGLYINRTGSNFTGLFGYTAAGSTVRNVGVIGGSVASNMWATGSLVGSLAGNLINSYSTGSVYGLQTVGGLVGVIDGGAIIDSHATGNVVGGPNGEAGGLVGLSWGPGGGSVTNSYATGNVSSAVGNVGGLMGINWGTVTNSYATGTANGLDFVGGLIGNSSNGSFSNSYATGAVTGRDYVGGLAGNSYHTISNSHATGAVTGRDYVGGLAGTLSGGASNSYATGAITGRNQVGGLVGYSDYGTITGTHASGAVHATGDDVGGLIGFNYGSSLTGNYASGAVTGRYSVGGFVGANQGGGYGYGHNVFSNNYASGNVSGSSFIGGLIGSNWGDVSDSHATGTATGGDQVGGLVGGFQSGSISNSYATGNVTATTGASGGLVGYASATISNSYATGSVSGIYQVGGILGAMNGGTITNAYATGSVTGTGNIGGLVGNSTYGSIDNTYSTGAVTGTTDVGGLLGSSDNAAVANSYWNLTTSGQSASAGGTGLTATQMQTAANFIGFNFTTTAGAAGNNWVMVDVDGTLNNAGGALGATRPMLASEYSTTIGNAHQLQLMRMNLAATYTLANDVSAAATGSANDVWSGSTFIPVGNQATNFTGMFDGAGHTIDNLTINRPASNEVGLFGLIGSGGLVQNVGLVGGSVIGNVSTGALAGMNFGTVRNSYATINVIAGDYSGGLVGYNLSLIIDSHATGTVTSANSGIGGLVGMNHGGTVSNSYATGDVSTDGYHGLIGGLVGYNLYGSINDSSATGEVTGYSNVGGLVGRNEGNEGGDGYGVTSYVGSAASITGSHATGLVSGTASVGGLVGENAGGKGGNGSSDTNDNLGTGGAGGAATIVNSYATGAVSGSDSVGGLIGANTGGTGGDGSSYSDNGGTGGAGGAATVTNSYASGAVSGSNGAVGGLVGLNAAGTGGFGASANAINAGTGGAGGAATIDSSYALGATSGSSLVGGLTGQNSAGIVGNQYDAFGYGGLGGVAAIDVSYSTGAVTGTTNAGGLVGYNDDTVTNSFWDTTTSGQATSAGGTGLATSQMRNAANFTGFNFTGTPGATGNNWVMVNLDGGLNGGVGATRPMLASEYSTTITNTHQLQLAIMDLSASYTLGRDIDAAATATADDVWLGTFIELAALNSMSQGVQFTGSFDGLGHTIANLNINRPGEGYIGLFGFVASAGSVRNVGLVGGSVIGGVNVGQLVGYNEGAVTNSYATGTVQGNVNVGGLIGNNWGTVADSYANAAVHGNQYIGGLVGFNEVGTIINSHAGGAVGGGNYVGGLAGRSSAIVGTSYATGAVQGDAYVGGLLGTNDGTLSNSYATGAVSSSDITGGLVGFSYGASLISNSYATGAVTGGAGAVGGLVGFLNAGTITSSFWNIDSSGQATSSGGVGTGLTAAEMMQLASFNSWNTTPNTIASTGGSGAIWRIYEGHTAPLLTHFLTALTLTDVVTTYNGAAQSGASISISNVSGNSSTGTNAGFYSSGFYSSQQGYDLIGGSLTINRATLTLNGTRVYNGTTAFAGSNLTASGVAGESFAVTGAGNTSNLSSRNVQTGSTLNSVTGLTLGAGANGGIASNYNALNTTGSSVSITRAALTLASANVIKTYNGTTTAAGTATVVGGALFGPDAISGGTFAFTDKNAGNGNKTVTTTGVTVNDGNSGGNYTVTYASNTTSTINRAVLTTTVTAGDKAYDGNTTAAATLGAFSGLIGTETLSATNAATFNSKDVAAANLVTVNSISLSNGTNGGLASNYSIASGQTAVAHITPRQLTVVDQVAVDKVYDGSTTAAATLGAFSGLIGTETLSATNAATFNSKDVAAANLVTVNSISLSNGTNGGLASNYSLASGQTAVAHITPRQLTVVDQVAVDKVYDGSTTATATLGAFSGLIGTETLSATNAASFNSKDVAVANLVTVNSILLSDGTNGGLASNYSIVSGQTAIAHITPRHLAVVDQVATDKVYDGTTAATLHGGSLTGVVAGESVGLNEAGDFVTADAGSAIAVTAADSLSGMAATNYTLVQPVGLSANITAVIPPDVPPVVAVPPVNVTPPVDVPASPPLAEVPASLVTVTTTAAYASAIGHVESNSQIAPTQVGVPAPFVPPVGSPAVGTAMTYDLSGLNLTVVTPDTALSAVPSETIRDDDDKK